MTDQTSDSVRPKPSGKRKKQHAASGARVLAGGLATSATIGLAGMMAAAGTPKVVRLTQSPRPVARRSHAHRPSSALHAVVKPASVPAVRVTQPVTSPAMALRALAAASSPQVAPTAAPPASAPAVTSAPAAWTPPATSPPAAPPPPPPTAPPQTVAPPPPPAPPVTVSHVS